MTGEINIFENAHRALFGDSVHKFRTQSAIVYNYYFAGLYVAQKVRSHRVQRTRFACNDIITRKCFAYAERSYSVRVADGYEFILGHNDESIRTLEHRTGAFYTRDDISVRKTVYINGNDFRINRRLKHSIFGNHFVAQLFRVGKISVVRDSDFTAFAREYYGLGVEKLACSGSRIPYVTYGYVAFGEFKQFSARKYVGNKPHSLVISNFIGVSYGYARRLLPPVLKGIKPVIHSVCHTAVFRRINAEHPAFFVNFIANFAHIAPVLFFTRPAVSAKLAGLYSYRFYQSFD